MSKALRLFASADLGAEGFERLRGFAPRLTVAGEPRGWAIIEPADNPKLTQDYPVEGDAEQVGRELASADILVAARLPKDLPERAPQLKWIHLTSTGLDAFMHPYLLEQRYTITNARGVHAVPISEFVFAGMLSFVRALPRLAAAKAERRWEKFVVGEMAGRTVFILGTGTVGTNVASRARAFGMRVVGMRRDGASRLPEDFDAMVDKSGFLAQVAASDFLVNTLPLTAETEGLVDAETIAAMKPSAVLVNVGRARTVDGAALRQALAERRIGGAVLDVYEQEPLPPSDPLWALDNVLLSPHMSAITDVRDARGIDILAENVRRYLDGAELRNVVDFTRGY